MQWIALIFTILLILPSTSQATDGKVYTVAIDSEYAPYEFVDVDGKVKGMLPDLLRAIGHSAGVTFQFLPMAWPDAVAALKHGRVDVVNMIRTPARAGQFEFSEPHSHIDQALFRNEHHADIHGIASIAGSRVALLHYDIAVEKLAKRDDFDRIMVNSKQEGFLMLNTGKVAAFFAAEQPGLYFLRQHALAHVEIAATGLFPQDFCFAAKKGNTAIIALLNRALATLKQSGHYDDIIQPWLLAPPGWLQLHKQPVLAAMLALVLLAIGFVLWNMQLRRTVARQTQELRQEREQLVENEAYRRTLYEQSPIGLALCRMDGCLVDINQAYADILGRSIADTLQLSYWDITPESYAEDEQRQLQALESTGSYGPYEKEYLHKDGHRVPVRLNGVILERGGERFIWSSVEDTRREKAQQFLMAEQAEVMQAVIENSPNGILVINSDARIERANPSACACFGYDKEELLQMTLHDLVPEDIRPQHFALFADEVAGRTHQIMGQTRELRARRNDGSQFPCAVTVSHFTVMGNKRLFSVLVQDLSQRKQAEQDSRRLASILEATSDFVAMADTSGRVLYINSAGKTMLGLDTPDLPQDLMLSDIHPNAAMQKIEQEILPAAVKHGVYQSDSTLRDLAGKEIPVSAVFMAHDLSRDGQPTKYSVIARDLTEERAMQAKIEHSQRLESLGVLAGGIAHDFNNILTAIMGNAAMAELKALHNPQDMPKYMHNIVESSEKAAELCKQMLAYSGKGKFVVKAVDLSAMVEDITKLLEISIAKGVVIKYHLSEQLPAVEADVAQMQQVIMNLIINASDAIGEKSGVISISTGVIQADQYYLASTSMNDALPAGRYVYLEVSDTGCGMSRKTQAKLFEPFFTTKFAGRGLGMSAVLGIVRGHHGTIKIYSESRRGTTFKVLLPLSDQPAEIAKPPTSSGQGWLASGTVLIVDDEETIRETAAMMLEDMGFATLTATDGVDGVRVYRERQDAIVAVLMDMTMPKMDGKTCYTELRRINKHVQVVLSSGYNEEEATSRFAGQKLAGFIQKPYTPDVLKEKMQQFMSRAEQ